MQKANAQDNAEKHIPKRLRGRPMELVVKLQKLHERCSYKETLAYYCSPSVSIALLSRDLVIFLGNQNG